MLAKWKKRSAIKRYLSVLPRALAKRYGGREFFSLGQVRETIKECGLPPDYERYALVLFLSPGEVEQQLGDASIYEHVRLELAEEYFGGDEDFNRKLLRARAVGNSGYSSLGTTIGFHHD